MRKDNLYEDSPTKKGLKERIGDLLSDCPQPLFSLGLKFIGGGLLILFLAIILAISYRKFTILAIGIISLGFIGYGLYYILGVGLGNIVSRNVECISITQYMGRNSFDVVFREVETGEQYTTSTQKRCPYAEGVAYIVYMPKYARNGVLAYEI